MEAYYKYNTLNGYFQNIVVIFLKKGFINFCRLLLLPFAFVYGIGFYLSRKLYDWGIKKKTTFEVPYTICLGNLSVGGTGKTPHTEFLVRRLLPYFKVAVLSRGYGRKTKGIRAVLANDTCYAVGDEPLQMKLHLGEVPVWVAARRAEAIPCILQQQPKTEIVVLDDALQHWALNCNQKILLTSYHRPFWDDCLLPMGRLREPRSGYQRADIIVVTQCPPDFLKTESLVFIKKIRPKPNQHVFFSTYRYGKLYSALDPENKISIESVAHLSWGILTGLAQTNSLEQYLQQYTPQQLHWFTFADHHFYSQTDLASIHQQLLQHKGIAITTEKDWARLKTHREYLAAMQMPLWVLPIEVEILFDEEPLLMDIIMRAIDAHRNVERGGA